MRGSVGLLLLSFKAQRYLLPLLLLVVLFQIVLGQTSSAVLGGHQPPLALAVQSKTSDEYSTAMVDKLSSLPEIEVIEVDPALDEDAVFSRYKVQGLVVLPNDFGERISQGSRVQVFYLSAPGITNSSFGREQVADAVVQLQSQHALDVALADLGIDYQYGEKFESIDLLDTVYEGPALQGNSSQGAPSQSNPLDAAPVFGVAGLLLLLAYLHAAFILPAPSDRRIVALGRRAYLRQWTAALFSVLLVWLLMVVLYFLLLHVLVGFTPSVTLCVGFCAIVVFSALLAALFSQLFDRVVATWIFLPLFILNTTIGGGLWGQVTLSPAFAFIAPVSTVVASAASALLGVEVLAAASIFAFLATLISIGVRFSRHYSGA